MRHPGTVKRLFFSFCECVCVHSVFVLSLSAGFFTSLLSSFVLCSVCFLNFFYFSCCSAVSQQAVVTM